MTVSVEGMHAQISGQVKTLEKMTAKERSQHPNVAFAKNYNDQLALAKEAMPDVDQRRWPPEATIFTPARGRNLYSSVRVQTRGLPCTGIPGRAGGREALYFV